MEILENRAEWFATFKEGWLKYFEETQTLNWKIYQRPKNTTPVRGPGLDLSKRRLMLISSAGAYLADQQAPFDAPHPMGDYTVRQLPSNTPFENLDYAHDHYDQTAVRSDPQVLLPLRHLETLVQQGVIGELTPSLVSYMGYQPDATRTVDELIPAILEIAREQKAQAALLVPA